LNENTRITRDDYERDTRHYEFDLKGTGIEYEVGDVLATYPHNQESEIDEFLESIKLDGNQTLEIERLSENVNELPTNMNWRTLFSEVLDVFGRPGRRFYEFLSICATEEKEKAELKHLLTKDGKDDLKKFVGETATYADLLQLFPSALPSLEYLIEYIPQIKPRLYSIRYSNDGKADGKSCKRSA
jgi:sulfite reductase (NADPH) flavoprotein alpha-component